MSKILVSIVIPIYKEDINHNEIISWKRCFEVFKNFNIIVVHPEGLDLTSYAGNYSTISFDKKYFKSTSTYNVLMCSSFFYKKFLGFENILIYQLDAYVFENNLVEWCHKGYSYIGAPWIDSTWIKDMNVKFSYFEKIIYPVGNGGLSLRKVSTHYYWSNLYSVFTLLFGKKLNEDIYWTSFVKRLNPFYKVPDIKTALEFAFEEHPEMCFDLNNKKLPFGCHAWEKYGVDFWKRHIK